MGNSNKLIRIYTGTEVAVILLKAKLQESGIPVLIKNDYQSGIMAGFAGGVPSAIDIYIQESDFEKAEPIVNEFMTENPADTP
jgi:hypothetical protein